MTANKDDVGIGDLFLTTRGVCHPRFRERFNGNPYQPVNGYLRLRVYGLPVFF